MQTPWISGACALLLAGAAGAQQTTPQQADPRIVEYVTARSIDRQQQLARQYCARDPQARAAYDAGLQAFRARNPDFVAVVGNPPSGEEARRAIASGDQVAQRMEPSFRKGMESVDLRTYCKANGEALPKLSWVEMKRMAGMR